MKILPLIFAAAAIIMPVVSQKTGLSKKYGFPLKMLCAVFYLATGIFSALAADSITDYSLMILAALVFGVLGDFFLEFKKKKFFPLGAVLFALGHIIYSVAFLSVGNNKALPYIGAVLGITLTVTAVVFAYAKTKLKLKGKKIMILAYAPVLVFSFACAVVRGVLELQNGGILLGFCLIAGGTLFFASDIMIGVGKGGIKRPKILHNAVSYTYFAAQALFALSILFQ